MRKVAKILVLILISIIFLGMFGEVKASSFKFSAIAQKEEVNAGDIVKLDLKVSDINAGKEGINVVEGIIEYDSSIFEDVKIENNNDWNITYNKETGDNNGKFLAVKIEKGVKQEEKIGQIQLQLKDDIKKVDTEIKIKEIKSNDGKELIDEGNRIIKIKVKELTENKEQPLQIFYQLDKAMKSIITDGVKTGDIIVFIIIGAIAILTINIIYFTMKGKELKEKGKEKYRKNIIIAIVVSIMLMGIVLFLAKDVMAKDSVYIQEMIERLTKDNDDNPESTNYLVTDTTISRVKPETTAELLEGELVNTTVNKQEDDELIEVEDKTEKVKTGMILKNKENDRIYKISVLGDINKDGELNQIELTKEIREYLQVKNWRITDDLEKLSADITCDGNIDEKDIESIVEYIVFGKLEVEEVKEVEAPKVEITEGFETETQGTYNSNVKVKITEPNTKISVLEDTNKKDAKESTTKTIYKITGTKEQEYKEIDKEEEIELEDEGVYKITAYTYGSLGNKSKGTTAIIVINDKIGIPEIEVEPTEWTNQKVEVTMLSDIEKYDVEYRIDGGEWTTYDSKIEIEENCKIEARITDGKNCGTVVEKEITNIDKILPIVDIESTSTENSITSIVRATDEESGIEENSEYVFYIKKTSEEDNSYVEKQRGTNKNCIFTVLQQNTKYTIKVVTTDRAGNEGIKIKEIQTGTVERPGEGSYTPTEWTNQNITVTLPTKEGYKTVYTIDGTEPTETSREYTLPFSISNNCVIKFRYSDDNNLSEEGTAINIENIDKTGPTINIVTTNTTNSITATASATDAESGIEENAEYVFYIKKKSEAEDDYVEKQRGTNKNYTFTELEQNTEYTVKITTTDNVGNEGKITKEVQTSTIEKPEEGLYTPTDWTNEDVTVTLPTKEGYKTVYTINGTEPTLESTEYTSPFIVSNNCLVKYKYSDGTNVSNTNTTLNVTNIDKELPTGNVEKDYVRLTEINLNITAQDINLSGIKEVNIYAKESTDTEYKTQQILRCNEEQDYELKRETCRLIGLTADTLYQVYLEVEDYAGNVYSTEENLLEIRTLPQETLQIQTNTENWTNKDVTATIIAPERYIQEGYTVEYQLSKEEVTNETENGWITYNEENKVNVQENTTIYARLTRREVKEEIVSKEVTKIDKVIPTDATITLSSDTAETNASITAKVIHNDEESGIKIDSCKWEYNTQSTEIGTDPNSYSKTFSTNEEDITLTATTGGNYYLHILTQDNAGNVKETISNVVSVNSPVLKDGSWDETKRINVPKIEETGLTAVYYENDNWVELTSESSNEEWNKWYDYSQQKWANAKSADGSMWVWIPRYEYKIDNTNKSIAVNFVKIGDTTTPEYILHPAFSTDIDNGGWDKELPGFWVAKYAAGFQNSTVGEENKTVQNSNLKYTTINEGYTSNFLTDSLTTNTKLSYPVFKPNTYVYNLISVGDAFLLSQEIDGKDESENNIETANSFYGLKNVNSHLQKNSEWGAVAYLTHSQYGVNGNSENMNEVEINSKNLNDTIYVNNATSGTKANVETVTSYGDRDIPNDINASSTKNMTGVFDLNGGAWEKVSGFYKGGNADKTVWHNAMANSDTLSSTKYVTLYETNDKKGDAINETENWNNDYSYNPFLESGYPIFARGGSMGYGSTAGIFAYKCFDGCPVSNSSFRVCLGF